MRCYLNYAEKEHLELGEKICCSCLLQSFLVGRPQDSSVCPSGLSLVVFFLSFPLQISPEAPQSNNVAKAASIVQASEEILSRSEVSVEEEDAKLNQQLVNI